MLTLKMRDELHLLFYGVWAFVLPNSWKRLKQVVQGSSDVTEL
jgi:hypothetical protein